MDFLTTANTVIEWIPRIVETVRNSFASTIGLYYLIAAAIALFGAYYFLRQFIVGSLFTRMSIVINYILIAILIYVSLVYLRV